MAVSFYSGVGNPKPRQQVKHKMLAQKKLRIKRNYQVQRKLPGSDKAELVKEYLGDGSQYSRFHACWKQER